MNFHFKDLVRNMNFELMSYFYILFYNSYREEVNEHTKEILTRAAMAQPVLL